MIFVLISFVIAAFAFGLGAVKLFHKETPFYFKLIVFAVGCFALEQFSLLINAWCGIADDIWVGTFGVFGCNFFMFTANYSSLDKMVDHGNGKKARIIALVAPVIVAAAAVGVFLMWKNVNMLNGAVYAFLLLPAIPASYLSLKHLLLPPDEKGYLKATRLCNITALLFYAVMAASVYIEALASVTAIGIILIALAVTSLLLVLAAIKGAKTWEI